MGCSSPAAGGFTSRTHATRTTPARPRRDATAPPAARHSRAYLRHLLHIDETLGARLATLHNLRFYLRLLEEARRAVEAGSLAALRRELEASEGRRAD